MLPIQSDLVKYHRLCVLRAVAFKGQLNEKILFHLFVAAIISMSKVTKFLTSDKGLRFYGFSKKAFWGGFACYRFAFLRGLVLMRMWCHTGYGSRTRPQKMMHAGVAVSVISKIMLLFRQIYDWELPVAGCSNVSAHWRCIAFYQIRNISDSITERP